MQEDAKKRKILGRLFGAALGLVLVLGLGVFGLLGLLSITESKVQAPAWLKQKIDAALNQTLTNGSMQVGKVSLFLSKAGRPGLTLDKLEIRDANLAPVAVFQQISLELALEPLLQRQLTPRSLIVTGVVARLSRDAEGRFDLALADASGTDFAPDSLAEAFDDLERLLSQSALAGIERVEVRDLALLYEDSAGGTDLNVTDGRFTLTQEGPVISMSLGFRFQDPEGGDSRVTLGAESRKDSQFASFRAQIEEVPARLIAEFVPSLAWLAVTDAPISGSLRSGLSDSGVLQDINGTLEIGAGAVRPNEAARPVRFDGGKAYFSYDQAARKIRFDQFTMQSEAATITVEGYGYLRDFQAGLPTSLVAQLQFQDVSMNPPGWFEAPLVLDGGSLDLRLRFDPFQLSIGQLVVLDGDNRFLARGEINALPDGWALSLDASIDRLEKSRLIELWPLTLKQKTRTWLADKLLQADGFNGRLAYRSQPGKPRRLSLGFEFDNASVRYLKGFPPVTKGKGYGSIEDSVFTIVVEEGEVMAPSGQIVDVADTVVRIPDLRIKPPPGKITLRTRASAAAMLSLIDLPPLNLLANSEISPEMIEGDTVLETQLQLPFARQVKLTDVTYAVTGEIRNMHSDKLVPERMLTAERLSVQVDMDGMQISGQGHVGRVPFDATWSKKFGASEIGRSRVDGSIELSSLFAEEMRLGLAKNTLSGSSRGVLGLEMVQGQPAKFRLQSDLRQLAISLPSVGWSKQKSATGILDVSGQLGPNMAIEEIMLKAPGLFARGSISLTDTGGLDLARFTEVQVGGWLDGPVELRGRGPGLAPAVAVLGGQVDIRKSNLGAGGGGAGGPLDVTLDRLIISEGIVLTGLRGQFSNQPAFNGSFTARVNGTAPIQGTVVPSSGGSAIRIRSDDAGAVIRASGLMDKANEGTLDMILTPRGSKGSYNGRLTIKKLKIRGASALADLLSAISVIGLLEQLNGQGIVFSDVEADFVLTPDRLVITKSSAIGPSLGVSLDGTYDLNRKWIDMQGVLSPIYLLNGIGAIFTRRGEGLFGFNFKFIGPAADPKTQVNPLSILTPGMFREIFRWPPPTVSQ